MPDEPTPGVEAPKPRKMMKLSDVKGSDAVWKPLPRRCENHPSTKEDIQKALDDGYLIEKHFGGNQEALFWEWCAASNGGNDRSKFIEVATRWHAGRNRLNR